MKTVQKLYCTTPLPKGEGFFLDAMAKKTVAEKIMKGAYTFFGFCRRVFLKDPPKDLAEYFVGDLRLIYSFAAYLLRKENAMSGAAVADRIFALRALVTFLAHEKQEKEFSDKAAALQEFEGRVRGLNQSFARPKKWVNDATIAPQKYLSALMDGIERVSLIEVDSAIAAAAIRSALMCYLTSPLFGPRARSHLFLLQYGSNRCVLYHRRNGECRAENCLGNRLIPNADGKILLHLPHHKVRNKIGKKWKQIWELNR